MVTYLEQFLRERVEPYRIYVECLPLGWRIEIREEARRALIEGVNAAFYQKASIVPSTLEERLNRLYELTARLGVDMGRLLLDKSAPCFRIGEDYAEIYSAVMGLFGQDKNYIKSILLKEFEPNIAKDRIRRSIAEAILN